MNKFLLLALFSFLFISGCSSDIDNAKKLGFTNPEQMKYLKNLGYKTFEEFRSTHPYEINSDTTKFAASELGLIAKMLGPQKESDAGEYYEGPKGVWMTADEDGKIAMIGYSCNNNKSNIAAKIDGVGCDSSLNEWKKFAKGSSDFCAYDESEVETVFIKNNSYLIINNSDNKVNSLGLVKSPKYFRYGQSIYDRCDKVFEKLKASKIAGFESIYEMDAAGKQGFTTASEWKAELGKEKFKLKYYNAKNSLEKALVVLVSTSNDFREFKDNGGLNVLSSWRGYDVSLMEVNSREGVLTFMHLTVDSDYKNKEKPATFNNLKKDLIDECGSNWNSKGRSDVYWAESDFSSCEISEATRNGYNIVVNIKSIK